MTAFFLSFIAGMLTVFSPCVLPLLPVVIGAALQQHRYGPLALAVGIAIAFTALTALIHSTLGAFEGDFLRVFAALLMVAVGIILLSLTLQQKMTNLLAPVAQWGNEKASNYQATGLLGQFSLGLLLGLIWIPCAGPTLGAAFALAASQDTLLKSLLLFFVFGIGSTIPLLLMAYGARSWFMKHHTSLGEMAVKGKKFLGAILLLVGMIVLLGFDKVIDSYLTSIAPDWLIGFSTFL